MHQQVAPSPRTQTLPEQFAHLGGAQVEETHVVRGSSQKDLNGRERVPQLPAPTPLPPAQSVMVGRHSRLPWEVPVKLPLEELPFSYSEQQERPGLCCFWTSEILTYFTVFFVSI